MSDFTKLFLVFFGLTYGLKLWLALRQLRYVWLHRSAVPAAFANSITLEQHQRAADYTLAKTRLSIAHMALEAVLLWLLTLGGGLQWLFEQVSGFVNGALMQGTVLLLAMMLLLAAAEIPLTFYRQFRIEQRFGFNRQTLAGYIADLLKQAGLSLVLGGPLILLVLWLMGAMGEMWWLWVWLVWMGFNLFILAVYPRLIAPLFNKFTPLEDVELKERIERLLKRTGFESDGVYVMDGSRRTSHGNAYFTGLGKSKRIVFFDTLLKQLTAEQIEAVLAHELGHFKHRHIAKRLGLMFVVSLLLLLMLAWLKESAWFYTGLGVAAQTDAMVLALFSLVLPVFVFPFTPMLSLYSRRHEFEADAFAAQLSESSHLIAALVRLYRDNAATLTPDPIYSVFYDSHPKATERIHHLFACPKHVTSCHLL